MLKDYNIFIVHNMQVRVEPTGYQIKPDEPPVYIKLFGLLKYDVLEYKKSAS